KTKKELLHKLRINVLDSKGRRVQMLKGIRNEGEVKDNLRVKFITLREEIISDFDSVLSSFYSGSSIETKNKIDVSRVFPGLPAFNMTLNEQGEVTKIFTPFTEDTVRDVSDIGYVENGKIKTKSGAKVNDDIFIRQMTEQSEGTEGRIPFVVFEMGSKKLAYPVRVNEEQSPVTETQFDEIFENDNLTDSQKANEINT